MVTQEVTCVLKYISITEIKSSTVVDKSSTVVDSAETLELISVLELLFQTESSININLEVYTVKTPCIYFEFRIKV